MKRVFLVVMVVQVSSLAFADSDRGNCSKDPVRGAMSGSQCVTAGTSAAAGVASGIYAVKKFSKANSIEEEFTKRIFNGKGDESASYVKQSTASVTSGDRVSFVYQLSEAENRQYHIEKMETEATSARTRATNEMWLSQTLMKEWTEVIKDSQGRVIQTIRHKEVDVAGRISHGLNAVREHKNAMRFDDLAEDARKGGAVPTYNHDHVIEVKADTQRLANSFIDERLNRGGKIMAISRLPVEKLHLVKSATHKAAGGVLGVALGLGLAAEEASEGYIAKKISGKGYRPPMEDYDKSDTGVRHGGRDNRDSDSDDTSRSDESSYGSRSDDSSYQSGGSR